MFRFRVAWQEQMADVTRDNPLQNVQVGGRLYRSEDFGRNTTDSPAFSASFSCVARRGGECETGSMMENSSKKSGKARHLRSAAKASAMGLLLAVCLCGCSTFNRDWRRESASAGNENSVGERWEGRWISE